PVAGPAGPQRGDLGRVGDDGHGEPLVGQVNHREADPVDRDRPLLDQVPGVGGGHGQVGRSLGDLAHRVDVALDQVAADQSVEAEGALEVDRVARAEVAEGGAGERLVDHVGRPRGGGEVDDGEATAVDG